MFVPPVDVPVHQTTLRVLDVGLCGLGQGGGQYLANVLHKNVRPTSPNNRCLRELMHVIYMTLSLYLSFRRRSKSSDVCAMDSTLRRANNSWKRVVIVTA